MLTLPLFIPLFPKCRPRPLQGLYLETTSTASLLLLLLLLSPTPSPPKPHKKISSLLPPASPHEITPTKPSFTDKELERAFVNLSKNLFQKITEPSLLTSKRVGNLATGSLWSCLFSPPCLPSISRRVWEGERGRRKPTSFDVFVWFWGMCYSLLLSLLQN